MRKAASAEAEAPRWFVRLTLPLPPSTNNSYVNLKGHGRLMSPALRQWKWDAGWRLKLQHPQRGAGPFSIKIMVPEDMRGDIDNRAKHILDLLVEHHVTIDDRYARSVTAERSADVGHRECHVVVEAA